MNKYASNQRYNGHSQEQHHPLNDVDILHSVEAQRRAHIIEAVSAGIQASQVNINSEIGRAGMGQKLYQNNVEEYVNGSKEPMGEATRAALAQITQTDGYEPIEVLRAEQPVTQNAYTEALTGMEENLKNNPTLPLDVDSVRAVVARSYVDEGVDELEEFANDPVNATRELI
jgi:hypothetical protein